MIAGFLDKKEDPCTWSTATKEPRRFSRCDLLRPGRVPHFCTPVHGELVGTFASYYECVLWICARESNTGLSPMNIAFSDKMCYMPKPILAEDGLRDSVKFVLKQLMKISEIA